MDLITRDDAHMRALKFFYTGVACKNGHDAPRYVVNGACRDCTNRRPAPGPNAAAPNVRVFPIAFPRGPRTDEQMCLAAIYQSIAGEALRMVRELIDMGVAPREIARLAYVPGAPFFVASGVKPGAASVGPMAGLLPLEQQACAISQQRRVDSTTGLEVLTDGDGVEQYRPDPFK